MTKRTLLIFVFVATAACVGALVFRARPSPDPVFEGKTLSQWTERHTASSAADPPYGSPGWHKANEAILKIGTNGIPVLLRRLSAKEFPKPVLKLRQWAYRKGMLRTPYRNAVQRNYEAEYAFSVLGTNAASAVPALIEIYKANISPPSQMHTALALGHLGRTARAALPALLKNFTHPDDDVRFYAVSAVYHIGGEPDVLIPAFKSMLADPKLETRWNAIVGLSTFGSRARSVVPDLLKALDDPGKSGDQPIKGQVEIALWRIAPERVGKPFVVEESTPMIHNGVTTEALKMTLFGERKTLIPAGKSVPAVAQYWNSDPRPRLTLYRGPGASDEEDHFLGEFEVLDLPESEDLNVSTLCVISDGRIILCARDNHLDVFLPIRRVVSEVAK